METLADRLVFEVPTKPGTPRATQDSALRAGAAKAVAAYARATGRAR